MITDWLKTTLAKQKIEKYQKTIQIINKLEKQRRNETDEQLANNTLSLKEKIKKGKTLEELLPEAFSIVREASWRILKLRHFDVQLIGGMILHGGEIAEMRTGEGKTIVALLPAYLNALTGKGVHIVTANEYLVKRDANWVGQVHKFLGLSVGYITQEMAPDQRRENYNCDICYTTNGELGFDYLRDNMATKINEIVQRPFHFCIVDEIDSILIDEARTPLIISGPFEAPQEKYNEAFNLSNELLKEIDYTLDEKGKTIFLTESGTKKCEKRLQITNLYTADNTWIFFIINALKAKEFFYKNRDYILRDKEIIIVDEFTGRTMQGRRWGEGLHQAIEAKENIPIQDETQTLATITYQSLFLLYPRLSGMTGTAETEKEEFYETYGLNVVEVPTNKKNIRVDLPDSVFITQHAKWQCVAKECLINYKTGRPTLVGTTSIQNTELLSTILKKINVPHNVLNAKPSNIALEANIIAQAGRKHTITLATNMAGRGTDILLGGNAEVLTRETILNHLKNKTALKNENAQAYLKKITQELSEEDEINQIQILNGCINTPEVNDTNSSHTIKKINAVKKNFQSLYTLIKCEVENEKVDIINLGGLFIIGTEKHESRRIDYQLKGRSARQGEPGSTRFFLSLEDNLLRIFGGEKMTSFINKNNIDFDEETPLESKFLSNTLEGIQKKVENYYFGARKELFQYDEVLATQRNSVYFERRKIINQKSLKEWVLNYISVTLKDINEFTPILQNNKIKAEVLITNLLNLPYKLKSEENFNTKRNYESYLQSQATIVYDLKEAQMEQIEKGLMSELERSIILSIVDDSWKYHLKRMVSLKEFISWRSLGQKDPLLEYKKEAYNLFVEMSTTIRQMSTFLILKSQPISQREDQ